MLNRTPKDWYIKTTAELRRRYGCYYKLMARLIAATSPRKQVPANIRLADRILQRHLNNLPWDDLSGILPSHRNNITRALNNEPLSGSKVRAFSANLQGDLSQVTIDVWVLRYMKSDKYSLTPLQYGKMADKIKKRARALKLKPAEYQAVIWTKIRGFGNGSNHMFEGITA